MASPPLALALLTSVALAATVAWLAVSRRRLAAEVARYASFMEHGPFLAYLKDAAGR